MSDLIIDFRPFFCKGVKMSYTPGFICELLEVPASTLRRWSDRFAAYLSPQAPQAGRHRTYTAGDLETFRQIRDLAAKGQGLRTIETILQTLPPGTASPKEPAKGEEPQAASGENSALMVLAVTRELGSHDAKINALQDQINLQNERLTALTEYLTLPWYKRIGKRPPIKY